MKPGFESRRRGLNNWTVSHQRAGSRPGVVVSLFLWPRPPQPPPPPPPTPPPRSWALAHRTHAPGFEGEQGSTTDFVRRIFLATGSLFTPPCSRPSPARTWYATTVLLALARLARLCPRTAVLFFAASFFFSSPRFKQVLKKKGIAALSSPCVQNGSVPSLSTAGRVVTQFDGRGEGGGSKICGLAESTRPARRALTSHATVRSADSMQSERWGE